MEIIRKILGKKYIQEYILRNYRSELRKKALHPRLVQWIATYKCNFKCDHCGTGAGDPLPDELNTKQIIAAIDSLAKIGTYFFSVTGGEPILRDDIFEVLKHAKSKGIAIGLVSNGYATQDYIEKLKDVNCLSLA